ncbi:phage regulatory protein/antirepressor Ant [Thioclava sp. NG1]|uniref:phage regulatory protein/antirepressor Ant n=1 Tax=Thioclava sp. NG1 TaxID=2182426 RepID=UPI001304EDED|nr:phage regulatory protein/antirepressor Ant [Thioclava sp. NG1]
MNMPARKEDFNGLVSESLMTTSRIIAEKFGKQHKDVLRAIKNLECSTDFTERNFAPSEYVDTTGRTLPQMLMTRDGFSFLVMGFTGKEAAAWKEKFISAFNEMEQRIKATAMLSGPQLMAAALIEANATMNQQAQQIADMREDVAAHDRLAKAEGSLNITESAKALGVRPKDLFEWLSHNGWTYKRPNGGTWLGYQSKCNAGLLEHKTTTVLRADGSEKVTEQVRVTAKGLTRLAKLVPGIAKEVTQ